MRGAESRDAGITERWNGARGQDTAGRNMGLAAMGIGRRRQKLLE